MQALCQAKSASVKQNMDLDNRAIDRAFDGATEEWLDRNHLQVIVCLLKDVDRYPLPDDLIQELQVSSVNLLH